jgi:uncharacterized small protein (DUF1192 family)
MDDEDARPRQKRIAPVDLDPMSVAEMNDYIAALEAEIARVRANIAAKEKHRHGADALFRK